MVIFVYLGKGCGMFGNKTTRTTGFGNRLGLVSGLCALLALAICLQTGCEQYGTPTPEHIGDSLTVALPEIYAATAGEGSAKLFFYRITSGKTGKRLGVGDKFLIEERRQVRTVVQLEGLDENEPMLLHFLWLNPDGTKMFTKDIHVQPEDWTAPELREALRLAHVTLDKTRGYLEAESRYSVSPGKFDREVGKEEKDKKFKTGEWSVRVYLYRKHLMTGHFQLDLEEEE
jgi:hypothetical protein